jgi:hypothetical protein
MLSIERNVCDRDVLADPTQGQGIYCEWYNYDDTKVSKYGSANIRNNIVFGNGGSFLLQAMVRPAAGQKKDAIVTVEIENNVVDAFDHISSMPFRLAHGGEFIDGSADVWNNIFIERRHSGPPVCMIVDIPYLPGKMLSDNNHFLPIGAPESDRIVAFQRRFLTIAEWQERGHDRHSIGWRGTWVDPMFVNLAKHDYHLSDGSPDIGAGRNLADSFRVDFEGRMRSPSGPWDIGAFQAER